MPIKLTTTQRRDQAIDRARDIRDNPDKYAIADVETTGFKNPEVLQFAAITPSGDTLLNRFFVPITAISPQATDVHGLTRHNLSERGAISWGGYFDSEVTKKLEGRSLVFHNKGFDSRAISNTCRLHNVDMPWSKEQITCSLEISKGFNAGTGKSNALNGDHDALGDSLATLDLLIAIAETKKSTEVSGMSQDDLYAATSTDLLWDQRNALKKEIARLSATQSDIEAILITRLENGDIKTPSGTLSLGGNPIKIKASVPLEQLPENLKKTAFDYKAVKAMIAEDPDKLKGLFTWERSQLINLLKK